MYFTVVFQGAPSGKTYCFVWNGYELTHCLNLLLHVYMKTKNRYYLIEMNSDCQLLKGNALFVEGNVAPLFQWTCLFEKPALVMFFLEEKNVFVDHPLKSLQCFHWLFRLGEKIQSWDFFREKSISPTVLNLREIQDGCISRGRRSGWILPTIYLRSTNCSGVLGES